MHRLKQHIFSHARKFRGTRVKISVYYATTGTWRNDAVLTHLIDEERRRIESDERASFSVKPVAIDADRLHRLYQDSRSKPSAQFWFDRRYELPPIQGVQGELEGYVGVISCKEFMKIILKDGVILRSIFEDNVRDYQGSNLVNKDIEKTLSDKDSRSRFSVLNNGVTVVAAKRYSSGGSSNFHIHDYQIVNGCQTSHVLAQKYNDLGDNGDAVFAEVYLPMKLIITSDQALKQEITIANNSQTEVKQEAFTSLRPLHKKLEDYYKAMGVEHPEIKLFYERRSKQYDFEQPPIKKSNIVSLTKQTRSFIAMCLQKPEVTSSGVYYGKLIDEYSKTSNAWKLFSEGHEPGIYFTAALGIYRIDQYLRTGEIDQKYSEFKYCILLGFRKKFEDSHTLIPDDRTSVERFCRSLNGILYDDQPSLIGIKEVLFDLERVSDFQSLRDRTGRENLTQNLLEFCNYSAYILYLASDRPQHSVLPPM